MRHITISVSMSRLEPIDSRYSGGSVDSCRIYLVFCRTLLYEFLSPAAASLTLSHSNECNSCTVRVARAPHHAVRTSGPIPVHCPLTRDCSCAKLVQTSQRQSRALCTWRYKVLCAPLGPDSCSHRPHRAHAPVRTQTHRCRLLLSGRDDSPCRIVIVRARGKIETRPARSRSARRKAWCQRTSRGRGRGDQNGLA